MNKIQQKRQDKILTFLKNRGTGVINISNTELSALMGVSDRTIARDLDQMDNDSIIIRETHLIKQNGATVKQRDIILKGELPRRFTLDQHRQLSNKDNHQIFLSADSEVMWNRRIDGVWQRTYSDKEFKSTNQAYSWLYGALSTHYKAYSEGDRYSSNAA